MAIFFSKIFYQKKRKEKHLKVFNFSVCKFSYTYLKNKISEIYVDIYLNLKKKKKVSFIDQSSPFSVENTNKKLI